MVTTSKVKLISDSAINTLKNEMIKKVELITPNIPEAEILSKVKINSLDDMIFAGKKLIMMGAKNVLLKGGHLKKKIFMIFL